jgi:GNAT superfamily N-acetyltransferase
MSDDFQGLYQVRDMVESDKAFIYSTILHGLYYGDSWFSQIPKDIFMNNYKNIISAIIDNPKNFVKVACLPEDPDVILGYSIISPTMKRIAWVYVKEKWRRRGIGRYLLPQFPASCLHLNELGRKLMNKYSNMVFDPFTFN